MISFKQFFIKRLLKESPRDSGVFETQLSDYSTAKEIYDEILADPNRYKKVFTVFDKYKVNLHEDVDGDDVMLYFVPENDNFIYGYATYELLQDGGIQMCSVYNNPMYQGLASYVYKKYLIPTYKYILSHSVHSNDGRKFWRSIVFHSLSNNMLVEVWDVIDNKTIETITNISQLDKYYSEDEDFERYRIKITK